MVEARGRRQCLARVHLGLPVANGQKATLSSTSPQSQGPEPLSLGGRLHVEAVFPIPVDVLEARRLELREILVLDLVPLREAIQEQIRALYAQDLSISRIAKQLGIAYGTAWNYVQALKEHEEVPNDGASP